MTKYPIKKFLSNDLSGKLEERDYASVGCYEIIKMAYGYSVYKIDPSKTFPDTKIANFNYCADAVFFASIKSRQRKPTRWKKKN